MLQTILKERGIPALADRETMLNTILEEVYGHMPPAPTDLNWQVRHDTIPNFCAGKAVLDEITVTGRVNGNPFSFPFRMTRLTAPGKHPFFVHINFRDAVPDRYQPTEELVDNGFSILSFCYQDVTKDNGDLTDGLAGALYPDGKRGLHAPGKIAMWAWAAQRVMDYAETLGDILDLDCAVVCGHSRLGKTALLTAATDSRFAFAYSNDSGCSGAAITRHKVGEDVKEICRVFPYWFCENYWKYADNEAAMPFDQHFLVACIAPRRVLIGSAVNDIWSDPLSEQLCCVAASPAFPKGFSGMEVPAKVGEAFMDGDIGYHLRQGEHYFSREDWLKLIQFIRRQSGAKE